MNTSLQNSKKIDELVDHLFRHESGKMVSVLSRLLGLQNIEIAEDIVQDTLMQAMNSWGFRGIPDNPSGWLYRVAKNKAIDFLRREKRFREIGPEYAYLVQSEWTLSSTINNLFLETEIEDSQLRMMFAVCHSSIPIESQLALALKTLCGLSNDEIARAFLTNESTIAKRIYRAKEKIRSESIELTVPLGEELKLRLDNVLKLLYLLFNEGYYSSHPDKLIREDLCEEAMRLSYLLTQNAMTDQPKVKALMALMCFQASRLDSRLDDKGHIVLLKYQDRSTWNRDLILRGYFYIDAASNEQDISVYHLEAAIASLHASAPSFEKTDWKNIYILYDHLYQMQPSPVVAFNKAIASAYSFGFEHALDELKVIEGMDQYPLYNASVGEMYFELGEKKKAKNYFEKAMEQSSSNTEKQLLKEKIELCS